MCLFFSELLAAIAVVMHPRDGRVSAASSLIVGDRTVIVGDRTVWLYDRGDPVADRLLSRVAANIGPAIDEVTAFWGADWPRDVSVVAVGSAEQFRVAAGGGLVSQWADIAAVTVVDRVDPVRRAAVGQRIVFAPGAATMSHDALRIVLTHELFHYAARGETALDAPRWLTEGVADFVARPHAAPPAGTVSAALSLPSDIDLDAPGPRRSSAYDRAWWFARFIAEGYGTAKLRELYLAAGGVGHVDLSTAVHDVLSTDPASLVAGWRQWLAR